MILFEGGLTAGWGEIRPVLRPAIGLKEGGLRGRALVYGLRQAQSPGRQLELASLNAVDAERVSEPRRRDGGKKFRSVARRWR